MAMHYVGEKSPAESISDLNHLMGLPEGEITLGDGRAIIVQRWSPSIGAGNYDGPLLVKIDLQGVIRKIEIGSEQE